MIFLKRLGIFLYALLMLAAGGLFLIASIGALSPEGWANVLNMVKGTLGYQTAVGVCGGLFVIIGIIAPYRMEKKLKKSRVVAFQNPDGEVTVSLAAVEDYIHKIAKSISGIKDIRSRVGINKKGINVTTDISMASNANIPEVTEKVQMEVRARLQSMLGVEEKINMRIHVKKIMKGSHHPAGDAGDEISSAPPVPPYREVG